MRRESYHSTISIILVSRRKSDYQALPGMYPHAAGKLASNGPYSSVKDIYSIQGLTDNDVKLFKKYERSFTVNPPGRTFDERINARVST
jgi:photosystem II PsbU protein